MGVANRLRSNPILAIGTVKVTAKHAEAVRECPTVGMEERFFLNRITLHATYIAPRYVERPPAIETDFADSHLPVGNGTAVSAGVTAYAVAVERFAQLRRRYADVPFQDFLKGWHKDRGHSQEGNTPWNLP